MLNLTPREAAQLVLTYLGGKGSGNWGHAGRPGERGGSAPGTGRSERSERALRAFKPATADHQRHAEKNELKVRDMLGGELPSAYNAPVDVIVRIDGKLKGIEVKTLINNSNDKITVRAAALKNKQWWARSNRATIHTVVIDDRDKFGNTYSGHRIYYARGSGSFRLSSMTKVENAAHLRELLSKRR